MTPEVLVLLLALSSLASADCAGGSTSFLPEPGGALAPGAQLLLQATGQHRATFESLADGELALSSGEQRVPLRVIGTLRGTFDTTQWVLLPKSAPEPGRTWTVLHHGKPLDGAWVTSTAAVPPGPPLWTGAPRVVSAERRLFGCGPAPEVVVEVPVAHAPLVEATVRPASGGYGATVRLVVADGRVTVGHGMCSGAFELEQGAEYLVDLVAIDAQGRGVLGEGPLRFTAP